MPTEQPALKPRPADVVKHYHCATCPRAHSLWFSPVLCDACRGTGQAAVTITRETTFEEAAAVEPCSSCRGAGWVAPPIPDHECVFCGNPTEEVTDVDRVGVPTWPEPPTPAPGP